MSYLEYTCGMYGVSVTARSGVLSCRYSSADAAQAHLTPLPALLTRGHPRRS